MSTIHRNKKGASAEKTQSRGQIYGFFASHALNRFIFVALTFTICYVFSDNCALASSTLDHDSIPRFEVPPLTKEATKPVELIQLGKNIVKKSLSGNIGAILGNNRMQSLSLLFPSVELRDFGGPGSLNMFSIRGLGPLRNIIVLDGIPLNSTQTGVFDLASIPIIPGQKVEIEMGGSSSVVGSGAMSGVINIQSPLKLDTSFASVLAGMGSFGEQSFRIQAVHGNDRSLYMGHIDQLSYLAEYPINFQPAGAANNIKLFRTNAQSSRLHAFVRASHKLDNQWKSTFWSTYSKSDRGVPGAVLIGKVEDASAELQEEGVMVSGSIENTITEHLTVKGRGSFRAGSIGFRDPYARYAGINGAAYDFFSSEMYAASEIMFRPSDAFSTQTTMTVTHTGLKGEMLQPFAGNNPQRTSVALSSRFLLSTLTSDFDIGVRADAFSDLQGPAFSIHLASVHEMSQDLSISAKLSRDFRVPSFNELYYLNYGTQGLLPETSFGAEAGCTYSIHDFVFGMSLYHTRISNQILAVPISPVQWSARNIGMVWSSGFEASCGWTLTELNLGVFLGYAHKYVIDKTVGSPTEETLLPYVPRHTISCSIISEHQSYSVGLLISSMGERFGMQGEIRESLLPHVILVNPHVEYRFRLYSSNMRLRAEVRNALDSEYSMILNFPLPGRAFVFLCGVTF